MPFDGVSGPPPPRPRREEPEPPLSRRDRLVAAGLVLALGTIALAQCRALLEFLHA